MPNRGHAKVKPINLGRITPGQSLDLDAFEYDEDDSPRNFLK
jgi:hypothetical protein